MRFAHRIKKPTPYVPAEKSDIRVTLRKARAALDAAQQISNVTPLKKTSKQSA